MFFEKLGYIGIDSMDFTPEELDPQSIWMRFKTGDQIMLRVNSRNGAAVLECRRVDCENIFRGEVTLDELERLKQRRGGMLKWDS